MIVEGYCHPQDAFDITCPKCGRCARFQLSDEVRIDKTPAKYRNNTRQMADQNWGRCQCDWCVSRFDHLLDWPADAFWQTSVGDDLLWAHTREELVLLKSFIESERHDPIAFPGHSYFLRHVPKAFLSAKRRETVIARIDRLLSTEE